MFSYSVDWLAWAIDRYETPSQVWYSLLGSVHATTSVTDCRDSDLSPWDDNATLSAQHQSRTIEMSIQGRALFLSWIHRTVNLKGNGEEVERHKGWMYTRIIKLWYTQLRQWISGIEILEIEFGLAESMWMEVRRTPMSISVSNSTGFTPTAYFQNARRMHRHIQSRCWPSPRATW